jgi:cell division ATPase FtsA
MYSTSIGLLLNGYLLEKEAEKQVKSKVIIEEEPELDTEEEEIDDEPKKKEENLISKIKDKFQNLFEDRDQKM